MVTQINCPDCNYSINVDDWFNSFAKSDGLYYFKCKSCKIKLGSTLSYNGNVCIWNKLNEIK